ncbi:MAG TPA: efflux RND transporter periplasmic adaptor subunit [Candidatus Binatia bacterium]|nr:efflux RND transporter periplasmic adaptor subunit [Candidatus Binatia bacterium]
MIRPLAVSSGTAPLRAALLLLGIGAGDALAQQPPPKAVETAPAQVRALAPSVVVTGQVQSRAAADLSAGVAGRLAWVSEPGTRVAAGGVVARLDTSEIELQRAEQAARVKRGEIGLAQLTREAERLRALGTAVSRVQLEQAEANRDLAAADLDIARATIRQTEDRLARAQVRAPFAGVVAERVRRDGEEVNRGDVVARLLNPESLQIQLFLPLRHVRAIRPGDRVKVRFEGREGDARVHAIVPAGDARSQSFEVLVELPPGAGWPAGGAVQVELPLGQPQALLAVPRDALIIRADGLAVFRVGKDHKAERIAVTTGTADGAWVAVSGGLSANDAVVVRGGESLHHGDPVDVVAARTEWPTETSVSPARSAP